MLAVNSTLEPWQGCLGWNLIYYYGWVILPYLFSGSLKATNPFSAALLGVFHHTLVPNGQNPISYRFE